jgi:hypothetical protein
LQALNDRAARGAREANEKNKARHAATMPRAQRKLSRNPSILGKSVPRAPLLAAGPDRRRRRAKKNHRLCPTMEPQRCIRQPNVPLRLHRAP